MVRAVQHAMSYFLTHEAFISQSSSFTKLSFHKSVHKKHLRPCMHLTLDGAWWRVEAQGELPESQ